MKQNRKGTKFVFQGKYPLEKFGQFAKISEVSESESSSDNEDDVIATSENEEDPVPPVAIVAEEYAVPMTNVEVNDDDEAIDDDEGEDAMNLCDDVLDFDDDEGDDFRPSSQELNALFDDVHDVVQPIMETEGLSNVVKPPIKWRRVDPRQGVLIREQASSTQHVHVVNEGPSVIRSFFETGESSSAPNSSSTPPPSHDVASEQMARFLAREDVDYAPRGKGISIGAESSNKEEGTIFELKEEIGILNQKLIEKDVSIGNVDLNLGALTAVYFDLKNKLIREFGDKFKTRVVEPNAAEASHCAHYQATHDPLVNPPPVRTTRILDRFESEPDQANPRVILKEAQKQVYSQKKGKWQFIKTSYQNVRGNQPQLTVTELGKKRFRDKYGDRS
ncbi:unnamed protein product [Lactuca saligna]|uniref:Uncharacterized protein n=1 Tax=Lactuca saligna TaxID=75948 RepID=A0AA35Y8C7_LACSI|nr:unnamed protein product [Lactuca saligna]